MSTQPAAHHRPADGRALIAVDLGAESCRVSLLRWVEGRPQIQLVHRFPNGPVTSHRHLRWPLRAIEAGVDLGMQKAAALAPEGVRSVAIDGWAVDYVRIGPDGTPLEEPFCYRDERTVAAEEALHARIAPERLREITGIQLLRINTLYQLYADMQMGLDPGIRWLNLPEYMLTRWGAEPVAEYTNASHTQLVEILGQRWSKEIFLGAGLDLGRAPRIVPPGTLLGRMEGPLAALPALRNTELIAPACHDTGSAIAGIPARGEDWGYISSGTWSLVGTVIRTPHNGPSERIDNFTNLGGVDHSICFHKNVNGLWLIKQCLDTWATSGARWDIAELIEAAEHLPRMPLPPEELLDVDAPDLLLLGSMPARINAQRAQRGLPPYDERPGAAPALARLIFLSLAERYAQVFRRVQIHTGKALRSIYVVGGGSRNGYLRRLTAEATGLEVHCGSAESATIGNFAVQLRALQAASGDRMEVAHWAQMLAMEAAST